MSNYDWLHGDTVEHPTDAEVGVGHCDLHIALISPCGAPRVAHDEVLKFGSVVVSPANSLHSMIHFGRASGIVINSRFVLSEVIIASIKGYRGRAIHQSLLQTIS